MRSVIRYATFEALGIRHTCCHDDTALPFEHDRTNEELEELRQENRFLVAHLNILVTEFEVELEQMSQEWYVDQSVSFWHGCWLPRMQQFLESIESAGIEADKVAAENIGVVWHEQESGKGKDCGGDSDSGSEDGGYRESDWDSEIDEEEMFRTFRRTMED